MRLSDPDTRNRLAEKVRRNHTLSQAGAPKRVHVLDSPPRVGRAGRFDRISDDPVDATRSRWSPEEWAIDPHALDLRWGSEQFKQSANRRSGVAGTPGANKRERPLRAS